jgi:hypothetical protein
MGNGVRAVFALGLLNLSWWRDRAWVTLPPNNPYVLSLAGRRRGVLVTLVLDTSECEGGESERLHNVSVNFAATITAVQRSDGEYWYKVSVPLKISKMLVPLKGCVKAQVFIEPWLTTRKATRATKPLGETRV